ncbi:hypothetical protein [Flavobacterium collinsii]|uniref:hypothetical protein n=1 Tax=Flavobacterium collinsii TaxID=1114861 RepID=UPI0021DFA6EA|nr:hypothetical protein [Flavobacterium collinsii]
MSRNYKFRNSESASRNVPHERIRAVAGKLNLGNFNYRGGVMAQWILQHQYGYKPFDDYLTYIVKMKKTWEK